MKVFFAFVLFLLLSVPPAARGMLRVDPQEHGETKPRLNDSKSNSGTDTAVNLARFRRELITLPYYGLFDWLEVEVLPGDTVVLRGQVVRPSTKSDAERRVSKLESVASVVNEIEVLPLSTMDDEIRIATYRAILTSTVLCSNTRLAPFRRFTSLSKNGRVTLKGVVARDMDRQLAYTAGRPGRV